MGVLPQLLAGTLAGWRDAGGMRLEQWVEAGLLMLPGAIIVPGGMTGVVAGESVAE
jgi:hypothetical protein